MCTAISYSPHKHYFGRTLDNECSYGEQVTILPRRYPLSFRRMPTSHHHYAMVGVTAGADPALFYDAVNEKGLCAAGLNFPGNARYATPQQGEENPTPYELIPWLLGHCATVEQVKQRMQGVRLAAIPYSSELPLTPLHWMVADSRQALVIESTEEGLRLYENPAGVLTNSPPFPQQLFGLENLRHLTCHPTENRFAPYLSPQPYSRGLGAVGLPGDWSSHSRFARAAFILAHADSGNEEQGDLTQAFHLLEAVTVPRGAVRLPDGRPVYTLYTAVCDATQGVYYIRSYDSPHTVGFRLDGVDPEGDRAVCYPLPGPAAYKIMN